MQRQKTNIPVTFRVVTAMVLVLINTIVYAQPPGADGPVSLPGNGSQTITPDEIADTQTSWMKKKLKLTKEQTEEVKKINKQYITRALEYQSAEKSQTSTGAGSTENKLKDKMAELDKDRDDRFKNILTDKQFKTYLKKKEYLEESVNTAANQEMPPGPPPGGF